MAGTVRRAAPPLPDVAPPTSSGLLPGLLAAMLALAALAQWISDMPLSNAFLAGLQVAVATFGFVTGCLPRIRPTQTIAFGFILPYLGVAPIYQMSHNRAAWRDSSVLLNEAHVSAAQVLILGFTIALLVGFMVRANKRPTQVPAEFEVGVRRWVPWFCLAACLVLTPAAVASYGGIGAMFSSRAEKSAALAEAGISGQGGAALAAVGILPASLAAASVYLFLIQLLPIARERGFRSVPAGLVHGLLLGIPLMVLYANPLIASRFLTVLIFTPSLFLIFRPRSSRAGVGLGVITISATMLIYPLANVFRADDFRVKSGVEAFGSADFDGFQQVINTQAFVEVFGHTFGHHAASAFLFFVPRSIWVDKAEPAHQAIAEHRGYVFTNLSLPIPAELFLEFGFLGTIAVAVIAGLVLSRLDHAWLYRPATRAALLCPIVAVACLSVVRGSLGGNGPSYLTMIALVFLGLRQSRIPKSVSRLPLAVQGEARGVAPDAPREGEASGHGGSIV